MKYPTRPIKENEFSFGHNYYDEENIIQEDGRIAHFSISKNTEKDGWKFEYYIDKYGFMIWSDEFRESKNGKDYRDRLLKSIIDYTDHQVFLELGRDFRLNKDEILFRYSYGGVLSLRMGWFVIKSGPISIEPNAMVILKSKMTIIS